MCPYAIVYAIFRFANKTLKDEPPPPPIFIYDNQLIYTQCMLSLYKRKEIAMLYIFLLLFFINTSINAADAIIKLQFNDKAQTVRAYPLKQVQLFTFIKHVIEDTNWNTNDIVPLLIQNPSNFEKLMAIRTFIEDTINDSSSMSTYEDLHKQVPNLKKKWFSDTYVDKMILMCADAYYLTSSDLLDTKKTVPQFLELIIDILIDFLQNNDFPSLDVLNQMPLELQKLVTGKFLGSLILDNSLNTNDSSFDIAVNLSYTITPYTSDQYILCTINRGVTYWTALVNKKNAQNPDAQTIKFPGNQSFYRQKSGLTPDGTYVYEISENKDYQNAGNIESIRLTFRNNETNEFKEKIIDGNLLTHLNAAFYNNYTNADIYILDGEHHVIYDKAHGAFFDIARVKNRDAAKFQCSLCIASCEIDSEFTVYMNKDVIDNFITQLDKKLNKGKTVDLAEQKKVRAESYKQFDMIRWQYINGYIIGLYDFNLPGLMYKATEQKADTLTYDSATKKWISSGQAVPNFISLSYPQDMTKKNGPMILSAYKNCFIPNYEEALNYAIQRLCNKLESAEQAVFDVVNLRAVTKNKNTIHIHNAMNPTIKNIIEIMNDHEEMRTILNAWYIYHASHDTNRYKSFDLESENEYLSYSNPEGKMGDMTIPDEILKYYPLPIRTKMSRSTLIKKPVETQKPNAKGFLEAKLQSIQKARATVVNKAAISKSRLIQAKAPTVIQKSVSLEPKIKSAHTYVSNKPTAPVAVPSTQQNNVSTAPTLPTPESVQPIVQNESLVQTTIKKIKGYFNDLVNRFKFW